MRTNWNCCSAISYHLGSAVSEQFEGVLSTAMAANTADYTVFQLAEPDTMNILQTIQDSMTSILEEADRWTDR